ncbi:MAG: DNA topoisomerase I, partial [bacterium]|nr:DNA topoisomerase I [bacterium]
EGCCPLCGGELRKRKGKFGEFMGCSNYPGCKYTYNLDSTGKHEANKVTKETEGKDICPECGSLLKERKGRFGPFIGCTDYPQCRFTREVDVESAAVEEKYSKK